jgi:hypothetical protein
MFRLLHFNKALHSCGAKCLVRSTHPPAHCAPLERQTEVGREVYIYLAPLEPEYCPTLKRYF